MLVISLGTMIKNGRMSCLETQKVKLISHLVLLHSRGSIYLFVFLKYKFIIPRNIDDVMDGEP